MSATTPLVTAAAMLDPLNDSRCWPFELMWLFFSSLYRYDDVFVSDARLWPGATTLGFTSASNHVGPRELYSATLSSSRETVSCVATAPTVIADGALPGEVTPVYPAAPSFCWPKFPADVTTISPAAVAFSTA